MSQTQLASAIQNLCLALDALHRTILPTGRDQEINQQLGDCERTLRLLGEWKESEDEE